MDGHNVATMGQLTINIEDVPEDPKVTVPTGNIKIPELHCFGCHLYDVSQNSEINIVGLYH
jgi:hypothetical protein